MDQINAFFESVGVLKKLGIDSTVIFQFFVFIGTFFLLKTIFFSKLLFVLVQREEKTTKLDNTANEKFTEAEKMSAKYDDEIHEANIKAQALFSEKKAEVIETQRARFKKVEAQVNDEFNEKRKEIETEFLQKKSELVKNADSLASELSSRLTT